MTPQQTGGVEVKRDMDLVRELLLAIEACEDAFGLPTAEMEGRSDVEVSHHIGIMVQAGLVDAKPRRLLGRDYVLYREVQLTWHGYEFLDAARNATIWKLAMEKAKGVGSFTFQLLLQILASEAAKQAGLGGATG